MASPPQRLEKLAKRFLTPGAARLAKRMTVGVRARSQLAACRAGFAQHGGRYPQKVLFIAGLPKSGTTWLEKMVASYPGFHEYLLPEVASHELGTGGSHDYELPADMFARFDRALVLTKMHVHGSKHNVKVLGDAGVRYVVLFRDLRDVAVSNVFYVRNTPWHPEHGRYRGRSVQEGLMVFAARTLEAYAEWVRSWHANRDPARSVVLRYEQMLADPESAVRSVAELFELDASPETVRGLVERFSFRNMSGGRERGHEQGSQFVRKGVAGDWVNHFTPEIVEEYKRRIGGFLVEFGYERGLDWSAREKNDAEQAAGDSAAATTEHAA